MLLWLVVALPGVIMLVVIAFLIQAATAYGQFALPGIPFSEVNTRVPARAVHRCLRLAGIRNIRLPFENAKLLLVSFLALHDRLRRRDCSHVYPRPARVRRARSNEISPPLPPRSHCSAKFAAMQEAEPCL